MKLFGYWRSTSSYRLRIALALKGIEPETASVKLLKGEQRAEAYLAVNPQGRVPAFVLDDATVLTQSPAIIEYLDEAFPLPPLLPADPLGKAKARAVAATIACDIHPLHNVAALNYLRKEFGHSEPEVNGWISKWIEEGLGAVEKLIDDQPYCFGPRPGLADVYLLPQLYAARRFGVHLAAFPKILRVERLASEHPAFQAAHPDRQPDAI